MPMLIITAKFSFQRNLDQKGSDVLLLCPGADAFIPSNSPNSGGLMKNIPLTKDINLISQSLAV